jgi:hypothetical protein
MFLARITAVVGESEPRNIINDGEAMYVTGYYTAMNLDQKSLITGPSYDPKGPAIRPMLNCFCLNVFSQLIVARAC